MFEGRMVGLREKKGDARFSQYVALPNSGQIDRNSKRFKDVCASTPTRRGTIPMFANRNATGRHE
jgi:hypothetical protein